MFLLAVEQDSILMVICLMPQMPTRVILMHYGIPIEASAPVSF